MLPPSSIPLSSCLLPAFGMVQTANSHATPPSPSMLAGAQYALQSLDLLSHGAGLPIAARALHYESGPRFREYQGWDGGGPTPSKFSLLLRPMLFTGAVVVCMRMDACICLNGCVYMPCSYLLVASICVMGTHVNNVNCRWVGSALPRYTATSNTGSKNGNFQANGDKQLRSISWGGDSRSRNWSAGHSC